MTMSVGGSQAKDRRKEEVVNHPAHYQSEAGIEAIDVIEAFGLGFHDGNAVKYILRAGKKQGNSKDQDIKKARWYLKRLQEFLDGIKTNTG